MLPLEFNPYSIALLMSGLTAMFMGFIIYQRLGGASKWFGILMLFISVWSIAYSLELSSKTLQQMLFWINIEYLGIAVLPALWMVFTIRFTGNSKWLTKVNLFIIFLFPAISLLLVWTNSYHNLHYASVGIDNSGPFPLLSFTRGLWYYVHTAYFYLLLAFGNYLLIIHYNKSDVVFRKQNTAIVAAAFIPWMVNLLYLAGIRPFGHIDLTPYAFILTTVLIGIGLLRFNLFNIIPLAHEQIIENMNDGIVILDSYNRIIDLNMGMRRILQNTDGKLIGKYLEHVLPAVEKLYDRVANSGLHRKIEFSINKRVYETDITHIIDKNSIQSGTLILFHDVTESINAQKQLEQQAQKLDELNKVKDKVFSILSHDLRSPLASLSSLVSMAKEGDISDEEFKSFLPAIADNINYTSGLIDNLLHWSQLHIKGDKIAKTTFDLCDITNGLLIYFIKSAKAKNIEIANLIAKDTFVTADKNMIQLVLRNLLSNAIKFSEPGGKVTIEAQDLYPETVVCVTDTGKGMDTETLKKLFGYESFTTRGTANEQGTGLGLLLCKEFVEKNGGRIWVESEQGKGSRFCFSIIETK